MVSYVSFVLVASDSAYFYVPVRSASVLPAVFATDLESTSRCIEHIASLSLSCVRFLPVSSSKIVLLARYADLGYTVLKRAAKSIPRTCIRRSNPSRPSRRRLRSSCRY